MSDSRYLRGVGKAPLVQAKERKPGDPQRSALAQLLMEVKEWIGAEDAVIDFGSGNGVLAEEMNRIWTENELPPVYVAVDLPKPLDALSLPPRIHNRSQKIAVVDFLGADLDILYSKIRLIVIRNVLHEMDIEQTGNLLSSIAALSPTDALVYIQDFEVLPQHEHRCAGWYSDLFISALEQIGLTRIQLAPDESHSGTRWFSCRARCNKKGVDKVQAANIIAACRKNQAGKMLDEIAALNRDLERNEDAAEPLGVERLLALHGDHTSIAVQLRLWENRDGHEAVDQTIHGLGIPVLSSQLTQHDYAMPMPVEIRRRTGLMGVLSRKMLIDFPQLLRTCQRELLFAGYSQRSFFTGQEKLDVLRDLLRRRITIRILLVDPSSDACRARSQVRAYHDVEKLPSQIKAVLDECESFNTSLPPDSSKIVVRLTDQLPAASYFFVDERCFVSLYAASVTGSRGPCFIYGGDGDGEPPVSYRQFLYQEFVSAWEVAVRPTDFGEETI